MKGFVVIVIALLTLKVGQFIAASPKPVSVDKDIKKSKFKCEKDKTKEITYRRGIKENGKSTGFGINKLDDYGSAKFSKGEHNVRDISPAGMLDFQSLLAKVRAKRGGPPPSFGPSPLVLLNNSTLMTSSTASTKPVTTIGSSMKSSLSTTSPSRSVTTTQGGTGNQNAGGSAKQSGKDCTCRNKSCNLGSALTVLFLSVMGKVFFL